MLRVLINRGTKKARFSGDSTFIAKDRLKALYGARWLPLEKIWEAGSFTDSAEDLKEKLFDLDLEIEELKQSDPGGDCIKEDTTLPEGLSVPQVINSVRFLIEERFKGGVLVFGVITALKEIAGKRAFLNLSDTEDRATSLNCVYWGDISKLNLQLEKHRLELQVDLEVMFHVDLSVNPKNGGLSAKILRIVPEYTLAKIQGEREKTNQRLKEEGLFENNKKHHLPFIPVNIGVLTSAGGTVIHDFKVALKASNFGFRLVWLPVSVQGESAKEEIIDGIRQLSKLPGLDLIVLFRGGGSVSDLAVFNSYEVAKEIANCSLPILSAIGHEEDQSSAQDVSYRAFGVPRDLGIFLANIIIDIRKNIETYIANVRSGIEAKMEVVELNLKSLSDNISYSSNRMIDRYLQRISSLGESVEIQSVGLVKLLEERINRVSKLVHSSCAHLIQINKERIESYKTLGLRAIQYLLVKETSLMALTAHVSEASPEVQLKRGYGLVKGEGGFIKNASELKVEDRIRVEFIDGEALAQILEIEIK